MIFGKPIFQSGEAGTVAELLVAFDQLATFCTAVGAKAPALELAQFANALKPHSELQVAAFCTSVRAGLSHAAQKPVARRKAPGSVKSAVANSTLINHHLSALRNAGADRKTFDTALASLKADNSLRSSELAEVARQYGLTVTKYKSMSAAHADIEKAFIRQVRLKLA